MGVVVERHSRDEVLLQMPDSIFACIVCPQELLKVKREHPFDHYSSARLGKSLVKGYAKLRTAHDVGEPVVVLEKFQHGQEVRICLDFVDKHKSVFFLSHFVPCNEAHPEIEVLNCSRVFKNLVSLLVLVHVEFNIIGEQRFSFMSYDEGLSDLPRAINQENLV